MIFLFKEKKYPSENIEAQFSVFKEKYAKTEKNFYKFMSYYRKHFMTGAYKIQLWNLHENCNNSKELGRIIEVNAAAEASFNRLNRCVSKFFPPCVDCVSALKAVENFKRLEFEQILDKRIGQTRYKAPLLEFII